jgi:hypothetical protein
MADKMKSMEVFSGQIERDWIFLYLVTSMNDPNCMKALNPKKQIFLGSNRPVGGCGGS